MSISSDNSAEFETHSNLSHQDHNNKTKLVYHLSSDDPWRASITLSDSQTMQKMGFNVTLLLSIEGVQLGVKHPSPNLGLNSLEKNVTDFINNGGHVIICKICLKIAGYNSSDIINGAVIGTPQITANVLNKTTVIDY
ncbi:MAG TPA: hypothetical protein VIY08_00630 [Candidatus Nitrosocosmicus sp.]